MKRSVRAAVLQLRAHDRADFPRVNDSIVAAVEEASAGAEIVILPEGTFPSYVLGDARANDDEAHVAAAVERLSNLARETSTVIVAGAAMRHAGTLHNAALVLDRDGSLAGRADKLFLWHFDRRWFEAGERLQPIATAAGKLGVLVCADGRLPTIARALVDRGAEMLVMPTAWVTTGRNPFALENVQADLLGRVRAYENGVPFLAANKCGAELGMVAYCGKSQIVDARGELVALAPELAPATLKAVVALGEERPHRTTIADVAPRGTALERPVRVGFSPDAYPNDLDRRMETLDDAFFLSPHHGERFAALDHALPSVNVGDATIADPGGIVAYRRAGYRLAVWTTSTASEWTERIARARALELRIYVVVFDRSQDRAYAVDPDGAIVAGTFEGFRLASFVLDPRKTVETTVAPGTDIFEGLERVAAIVHRESVAAADV
ncbi:MAG: carbon-nitrogen hydrolase family protein [Candidatus Eremiobacteraeota bacterium]|nr:carbon-nitrogen hydrolase family protein [Candidatus Eremiobacteraeota bacterium]